MKFVTMPGQSYTGSTLLAFLLETNSAICSNGSICGPTSLSDTSEYLCSCRERLIDCDFWSTVAKRMTAAGHDFDLRDTRWPTAFHFSNHWIVNSVAIRSLRSDRLNSARNRLLWQRGPVARSLRAQVKANLDLARIVCEIRGAEIFAESTRDPLRPLYLARFADEEPWVIHLVRDPRANVASIMRHKRGVDVAEAARRWWRANTEALRSRTEIDPSHWIALRYEDLCADPQDVMNSITTALGVQRATLPDDFKTMDHHILGNEMRLGKTGRVILDTRWRDQLGDDELAIIERQCRPLAEELGYEWSGRDDRVQPG